MRPLEMRTGRTTEGRQPKSSADINGYNAAVRYLLERTDFERMRSVKYNETTFKLERMHELLAKLGNPHAHIRTVHVAGTNGKGSTVQMIASMLQTCGYTVGVYTSPHLVELRERIVINGQMIDKAIFAELMRPVSSQPSSRRLPQCASSTLQSRPSISRSSKLGLVDGLIQPT